MLPNIDGNYIVSLFLDIFISFLGVKILRFSLRRIKNGEAFPFYIFSLILSLLYFLPSAFIKTFISSKIYFEKIYILQNNLLYYSVLENLDSKVYLIYSFCNLVFAIVVLCLLPLFNKKYVGNYKYLKLKTNLNKKTINSFYEQKRSQNISNLLIIIFFIIFMFCVSLINLIRQFEFSSIWALRHYITSFIMLAQGENSIYELITRLLQSIAPPLFCIAYLFGNSIQKKIVFILSLSLLLSFSKLPFSFFLGFISLDFIKKSLFIKKTYKNIVYKIKLKYFLVISFLLSCFLAVYQFSNNEVFSFRVIINSLLNTLFRFTLSTHASNLIKLYFWQINGFQNFNIEGSRLSALYHGVNYQPSNYFFEITDTLYGVSFGDTASFISLSIMRGGFILFFIELFLLILVPVIYDFIYKYSNSLFLRNFLRFSIAYYVFILISVESQTLLTYYFYGYLVIILLSLNLSNRFYRYLIR